MVPDATLMAALLVTIHVLVSLFLIFVILLQPGKGDSMASLGGGGGGGASSVFGGRGSVTFLAKITQVCAVIFMCTSLILAYRSSHSQSVMSARRNLAAEAKKEADAKKATEAAKKSDAPAGAAPAAPAPAAAPAAPAEAPAAPAAPAPEKK
jgi:preprotein translocase subunit SecG